MLLACAPLAAPATADVHSLEVQEYHKDFGVSLQRADELLLIQQTGEEQGIVPALESALGERYAGVWFDNSAGEFVIPVVSDASKVAVASELSNLGLEGNFRTVPAESTLVDLEGSQRRLDRKLDESIGGDLETAIDLRGNVVLVIEDDDSIPSDQRAVDQAVDTEPGLAKVVSRGGPSLADEAVACYIATGITRFCDSPLRGGVAIYPGTGGAYSGGETYCTAGFKASNLSTGARYMLTAGHCAQSVSQFFSYDAGNPVIPASHYIGPVAQWTFGGGDWAKVDVTGRPYWDEGSWPSQVAYWGVDQAQSIASEGPSFQGQYVCHSGSKTGAYCGFVSLVNVSSTVEDPVTKQPVTLNHLTEVKNICIDKGDSGGPVFAGSTALGLVSLGNLTAPNCENRTMKYMEILEATDALGVNVGTRATTTSVNSATALNGTPGWATVKGTVHGPGGATITGKVVNINFKKKEGASYVFKSSVQVPVTNNNFELNSWNGVGSGEWVAKVEFPAQAPYGASASNEATEGKFTVKDGVRIVSKASSKCVDIKEGSRDNSARVQQWDCLDPPTHQNQIFTLVPQANGYYQVKNRLSGRCLDVVNGSGSDGAEIQQYTCLGEAQSNQMWQLVISGSYYELKAKHSGKCLDLPGGNLASGTLLQQWTCNGSAQQKWSMQAMDAGPIPTATGLTVPEGERLNGTPYGFATAYGYVQTGAYGIGGNTLKVSYYKENGSGKYEYIKANNPTINSEGRYEVKYEGLAQGNWIIQSEFTGVGNLAGSKSGEVWLHIGAGYRFFYKHSEKCMSLNNNQWWTNGTLFLQWDCSPNPSTYDGQVFTLLPIEGGYRFNIVVNSSGRCLDVTAGSQSNGAWFQQWDCNGSDQQRFQVVPVSGPWQALIAKHSGKCMDINSSSTANGVVVQQWDCQWSPNQQWKFQGIG